ncbi:MAG: ParB-like protein partition protein [Candidatus Moranbacteria bacterium GW2011_GWE1_49_15]|nr:MAG: ParB-like protein partition protein [Candidatus Moranbacteria bacterium GW2011_GWE2_47_10]KKW05407.1 MAG: ParB-like protein partition protein [Candidatus Moranbacteria bacterium GW2011_GWE1_49_15]HBP01189.1 chromosome partitioning protein ParB [Candidatus Moranbacteria bacterium]
MAQNYGLGRGLSSLIPNKKIDDERSESSARTLSSRGDDSIRGDKFVIEVDVNNIVPNPHQPRVLFDDEKLEDLAKSIRQHGVIQPLVVSHNGARYELIAGERRLQASKRAGLRKVPVIVRDADEKQKLELAIIENVQRHDLNAIEEAKSYKKLMEEYQMSQEEVADKMGKSRSLVANKVRLLGLPVEIQRALIETKITEGHAKAILSLDNPEKQRALFELILRGNLTVRQTEDKTKEISVKSHKRVSNVDPQIKELEEKLVEKLGTKVKITKSGDGGRIVVEYYSQEDLDALLGKLA